MKKTAFCICENKDADLLRGNREADQRLCFRYSDSTIPLLFTSEISSHLLWLYSPVCVGPGRKSRRPVFSQRGSIVLPTVNLNWKNLENVRTYLSVSDSIFFFPDSSSFSCIHAL